MIRDTSGMPDAVVLNGLYQKWIALVDDLDERGRRRWAATEAMAIGRGGNNGHRNRLWKLQLQALADELGMIIEVCHYPPGTSKWNKIEHRLFCHITRNWRGVPLESHEVVVNLVSSTRTSEGLEFHCWLDDNDYQTGRKVTNQEMKTLRIKRNDFHGDWNYEIRPHPKITTR